MLHAWLKGTGMILAKSILITSWTSPVTLPFFYFFIFLHLSLSMFCSWSSRDQADLGWSWMCVGRGCGSVCTVVPPWYPAQGKSWNTRQYPSTVCWSQTPAPGDAQDLVVYQWKHHLEDSHKCSQKSKCWDRSASWWTGEKVLPGEESWSGQRYVYLWQLHWQKSGYARLVRHSNHILQTLEWKNKTLSSNNGDSNFFLAR